MCARAGSLLFEQPVQGEKESTAIAKEFKLFSKVAQIPPKADPMAWWAEQAPTFPLVAQLARRLLAIPASSAPTERLFSKLARINATIG